MIEANEINSTFYALRLLSHGLDVSELDVTEDEEYPSSEFTREEQEQALNIIHNIENCESVSSNQLLQDRIDFYVTALANRIEELANRDLAIAGYDVETTALSLNESPETDAMPNVPGAVTPLRVLIAEDQRLVRAGIRTLLERQSSVDVVNEASDGREALRLVRQHQPDIVLVDISMPALDGLEVVRQLAKDLPKVRCIVLSMHEDEEEVRQALNAGAWGYLVKSGLSLELEPAIERVAQGQPYVSPMVLSHERTAADLTPREREILRMVAEGSSTKYIASTLGISVKTVKTHRAIVMERLGVRNLASLVRWALRNGLLEPGSVEGSSRLSDAG